MVLWSNWFNVLLTTKQLKARTWTCITLYIEAQKLYNTMWGHQDYNSRHLRWKLRRPDQMSCVALCVAVSFYSIYPLYLFWFLIIYPYLVKISDEPVSSDTAWPKVNRLQGNHLLLLSSQKIIFKKFQRKQL